MPDRTDIYLAARAIRCPSCCTENSSHLDLNAGDGGVLQGHVVLDVDLPPLKALRT